MSSPQPAAAAKGGQQQSTAGGGKQSEAKNSVVNSAGSGVRSNSISGMLIMDGVHHMDFSNDDSDFRFGASLDDLASAAAGASKRAAKHDDSLDHELDEAMSPPVTRRRRSISPPKPQDSNVVSSSICGFGKLTFLVLLRVRHLRRLVG
jgi:hypothetical protein